MASGAREAEASKIEPRKRFERVMVSLRDDSVFSAIELGLAVKEMLAQEMSRSSPGSAFSGPTLA